MRSGTTGAPIRDHVQARSGQPFIGNVGGDQAYNGVAYTGGSALPIPPPIPAPSRPPKISANAFSWKPGHGVGAVRSSGW